MGLDMYLEAKLHLPPYNKELAPVRHAIGQAIGYTPTEKPDNDATLMEITGVIVRVGAYCQRTDHALPTQLTSDGTSPDQRRQPADHLIEGRLSPEADIGPNQKSAATTRHAGDSIPNGTYPGCWESSWSQTPSSPVLQG